MVLTYMEVHLYYTLPVVGLLFYFLKPYHTTDDSLKYKFLCLMAFVTASIWDNYIVYHRAWSYCPTCVVAVIGYVPFEEYMFFIVQSLMTVAFTNCVMRWKLPTNYIKPNTPFLQSLVIRFVPILGFLTIGYKSWYTAIPDKPLFYGSCILWYTCPVLGLLWFGAGEYILRRSLSVLISIMVPTFYLWWVDTIAIEAGTWHISLRTSTGRMITPNLPIEEGLFFLMINIILVFATCAIDRALNLLYLQERHKQTGLKHILNLAQAFFTPDQFIGQIHQDLIDSTRILQDASKSFYTAAAVFPAPIRQDLCILYAFCRATDDLIDDETQSIEVRKGQLIEIERFVRDLFDQKKPQTNDHPAFRCFSRLRSILRLEPVLELLEGYRFDLERGQVKTEEDLIYYSRCVASSVGEMCTRIILSYGKEKDETGWIIKCAREMGLALQYTNIARDIVLDSQTLNRCYLPKDWLKSKEFELISNGKAKELGHKRLLNLSHRLIDKANQFMIQSKPAISYLPYSSQGGVRAACDVYGSIGQVILNSKIHYPTRAHVKSFDRAKVAFSSVYQL